MRPKKKSKPLYLNVVLVIAMVLFLLGFLGFVLLNAHNLSTYLKENIAVNLILKDNAKEVDIQQLKKIIETKDYVKSIAYISKEDAAKSFSEEFDEEFLETLGYNPLFPSFDIRLNAKYSNTDSLTKIKSALLNQPLIEEVEYQEAIVQLINKNIRTLGIVVLAITGLLLLISLTLIDSTIKLSMYSNRFIIRSMQLVGATRWFITKPFDTRSIVIGFVSTILAIAALTGLIYWLQKQIAIIDIKSQMPLIGIIFIFMLIIGVLISWLSTHRAVLKYLKSRLDDLY